LFAKEIKVCCAFTRCSSFPKQHWAGREKKEKKETNLFSLKMPQRPLRSWLVIPRINTKYYLIFYAVFEITKENEENKHEQEWDCKPEIYDSFFFVRFYFLLVCLDTWNFYQHIGWVYFVLMVAERNLRIIDFRLNQHNYLLDLWVNFDVLFGGFYWEYCGFGTVWKICLIFEV